MNTAELLDKLEKEILYVAGDLKIHCLMGGDPTGALAQNEDHLGEMLKCVLDLKKQLGVPSNLSIVEEGA